MTSRVSRMALLTNLLSVYSRSLQIGYGPRPCSVACHKVLWRSASLEVGRAGITTHSHYFAEGSRSCWQNHELLHGQFVSSVGPSIDDIEGRYWKNNLFVSREIRCVPIQRDTLVSRSRFTNSQRHAEYSIGS